jgi:predicted nucleic acid-binding protein
MIYVLDTNIISYFLQENQLVIQNLRKALAAEHSLIISPITYYEIWRGFKHRSSPKKEKSFEFMCTLYPIGEISLDVWKKAAELYGETRKLGNPIEDSDILIAAFCLVNKYALVTNNVKHFKTIDGLYIENWMDSSV